MLSNQILHKTAQDIREITGFDCAIWDMQGLCLVRTNENLTEYELQIQDFLDDEEVEKYDVVEYSVIKTYDRKRQQMSSKAVLLKVLYEEINY